MPSRFSDPLGEHIATWANLNPKASRVEWAQFAADLAGFAYREGYIRGFEYIERDPSFWEDILPDAIADAHDPGWREHSPPVELREPHALVVEDEVLEPLEPLIEPFTNEVHVYETFDQERRVITRS